MDSADIRNRFLKFFEKNGHTIVPSASLIADDPTLLLVPAGMVPFKPYFLGEQTPPWKRATSVQKCVRTPDIDEVGKTTRHATFFQMAGNFSFGDYFKAGAIPLAWELLTSAVADGGYGFDGDRLWVTVYQDDDEAIDIWHRSVGVPLDRIQRRGLADNYWHMGVPGPGGPCSEIYFDRGPEYGKEGGPVADEDRYLEVWNLVFMQSELSEVRTKVDFDIHNDLPAKNIDTGLGCERMAAILQGVENIYEIDTTRKILDRATELTGVKYGQDERRDVSLRVIADHSRTAAMLIGDGVTPGNEGRGYVLRRIMRRVTRNMRILGGPETNMRELIDATIAAMSPQYPELLTEASRIHAVAEAEEAAFLRTLRAGTTILDTAVADTKKAGSTKLSGEQAFTLHDTYGFPIDLTLEMAAEQGIEVDRDAFTRLMAEQRARGKADAKAKKTGHVDVSVYRDALAAAGSPVDFLGYTEVVSEASVLGLISGGTPVPAASEGDEVEVVLNRTPFYAEGGGQLADQGVIVTANGARIAVHDVQSPLTGLIVHRARVIAGQVTVGEAVRAEVDVARRGAISRSHTATHLVHKGLREALGETAAQAGSENSAGRFRFDFSSPTAVPSSVLHDVEDRVNQVLIEDHPVVAELMSQEEAKRSGAIAMFGEKYGDTVRVVSVGDYSRELCGGTHVARSGQLGLIKLLGESSIGAGVRRVEALVGTDAYRFLAREHVLVSQLADTFKARPEELPDRIAGVLARLKEVEKELEGVRAGAVLAAAGELAANPADVNGVAYVGTRLPDETKADDLRKLVLDVRGRLGESRPSVVVAVAAANGRPALVIATNEAGRARGLKAGALVKVAAGVLGGGGGGKDDVAQGGGQDASKIDDALAAVAKAVADTAG
ncbi:alanine--tRNA ligase [Sporichthya polymorpha]|uniref:alanine--tRNA ligase n=1 Tax=Sporichthya polymorpha TaxID=35751 RepID=UPI000362FA35|nr:alanine--tRNA ligase [Sporichthya polymorpha]